MRRTNYQSSNIITQTLIWSDNNRFAVIYEIKGGEYIMNRRIKLKL